MRIVRVFLSCIIVCSQIFIMVPDARATDSDGVVIAQMYPGATGTATKEFVELYNNADYPIAITNWCINYISASGLTKKQLACVAAPDATTDIMLAPSAYAVFVSTSLNDAITVISDGLFTGGINPSEGHVQLVNESDTEIDRVGWGGATNPETAAVGAIANGKSIHRKAIDFHLQDTNDNSLDFAAVDPIIHSSGVYEQEVIVDVCPNIDEAQMVIPDGYLLDEDGDCQPDSCLNIEGLQITVPDGFDASTDGECLQHDECDNVDEIQATIPFGMVRGSSNDCVWNIAPIVLTELLPDPVGADSGGEYIEIYNPTSSVIDLSMYTIRFGIGLDKTYTFPFGAIIGPGEYRSFTNTTIKFSLINSISRVQIVGIDNVVYGDSGNYENPKEGESWALIKDIWQYTNRPTPDAENLHSIVVAESNGATDSSSNDLKPCAPDQFRNPETNRCKKIVSTDATLKPCRVGQERNPETNRCRNVVSLASAVLKPCDKNQYRSPETNRCRKVQDSSVPSAEYAAQPVQDKEMTFVGWWIVGGVGVVALGYGIWEWRREIVSTLARLRKR